MLGRPIVSLGSVMMPVVWKDEDTKELIKFIFYALVVPDMTIPVFMSGSSLQSNLNFEWDFGEKFVFDNGQKTFRVKSIKH